MSQPGLDTVLAEVVAWSRATFPDREPLPTAAHLSREVSELMVVVAAKHPGVGEEVADVVILAAALADCLGLDLADAVATKLDVLRRRTWAEPDAAGVREHVRTEAGS